MSASPQVLGPPHPDSLCRGVNMQTCLERTAHSWRLWNYAELKKWARAVAVADWDTTGPGTGGGGCQVSASDVKKARNGAMRAFASNWLDDRGLIDEWFLWADLKNQAEAGFHAKFWVGGVEAEHAFVLDDGLGEQGIWEPSFTKAATMAESDPTRSPKG